MKIFIPELKTKLELTEPWRFNIKEEYRQQTLFDAMGITGNGVNGKCVYRQGSFYRINNTLPMLQEIELPIGTVLLVDRVYIKNNQPAFNSITFKIIECHLHQFQLPDVRKKKCKARFWVNFGELKSLEFNVID